MKSKDDFRLHKIVYFDEGSATDYIQLVNEGDISIVNELFKETNTGAQGAAEANLSFGAKLLKMVLGANINIDATGKAEAGRSTHNVVRNIIENTVLTDFLKAAKNDHSICRLTEYEITPIKNSLASYALVTPYLSMLRDGNIAAGDFDLALEKLDSAIKNAKGYFEYLGTNKDESECIFRFNNRAFKNNYSSNNLMRMNLTIYAAKVGVSSLMELDINYELNFDASQTADNPDYQPIEDDAIEPQTGAHSKLDVYDVILAGVAVND